MRQDNALTTARDEDLCRRSGSGDSRAEEVLVLRYQDMVRRCCRPLFLMGGDQEDLLQEGMLGLLSAIRSYAPDRGASFSTYAWRCIRSRLLSAVRSAASNRHETLNSALPLEEALCLPDQEPSVEQQLIRLDSMRQLRSSLTELEGGVLDLYLAGLPYREIAQRLGRSPKSVDNAVQRIRKKWAEILTC